MALSAGTRLGPYEILAPLGAGGMGEVYRARDTTLGRDVAVKVLPEGFSRDTERLARFEREARVLASLNHPHIATLHGFEQDGERRFLVMELVGGEDLATRLKRGPLRVREALPVFLQVAEGLEAAHERGVVHRDLKPANIKVAEDGTVKILDFGLAKATQPSTAVIDDDLSASPTLSATHHGEILGTAAYMSPEQAQGQPVDKRTDIWAFGCCLYEALSGDRVFRGDTTPQILARILERDPKWEALPGDTPDRIRELLRRCLEKDPRQRLHDIADARLDVVMARDEPVGDPRARAEIARVVRWRWGAAGLVGGVLMGALVMGLLAPRREAPSLERSQRVVRATIPLPDNAPLEPASAHPNAVAQPAVAVSPDGSKLVYVARRGNTTQLYWRPLDGSEFMPLPGTEGGFHPVFSPDSSEIAFATTTGYLKKVSLAGDAPKALCTAKYLHSMTWGGDNRFYFDHHFQLHQVSDEGGRPDLLGPIPVMSLVALPEGRGLLLNRGDGRTWGRMDVWPVVHITREGESRPVSWEGYGSRYLPTGHLLFVRRGQAYAAPLDLESLELRQRAVPVLSDLWTDSVWIVSQLSVSDTGTLVYARGGDWARTVPTWVDRQGKEEALPLPPQVYGAFKLSPDGRRLAIQITDPTSQIQMFDLERGTSARLTLEGINMFPIWTADGTGVIYSRVSSVPEDAASARESAGAELILQAVDGTGDVQRLIGVEDLAGSDPAGPLLGPEAVSPDGVHLLLVYYHPTRNTDIWALPLDGEAEPGPLVVTEHMEGFVSFSPDGRWFTFVSDKTGRPEIFVRPFAEDSREWQVSSDGGEQARWSPRGDEIFYRDGRRLMAVSVSTDAGFHAGTPRVVYEGDFLHPAGRAFDVTPDGERFLVLRPVIAGEPVTELQVVVNWFEELEHLIPAD